MTFQSSHFITSQLISCTKIHSINLLIKGQTKLVIVTCYFVLFSSQLDEMSSKPNKYKKKISAASQLFIANVWSLFPSTKLKLAKKDVGKTYKDYGTHKFTLKFDEWSEKEFSEQLKGTVGTRGCGLWYENGHSERLYGRQMCRFSS